MDDRRLVDSNLEEALVTSSGNRLQVRADFESTADLDTLETSLNAIETLLGGTIAISAASLPLPTGAATSANQATTQGKLDTIETTLSNLEKALATIATDKLRVSNVDTVTVSGTVTGQQSTPDSLRTAIYGIEGSTQRQVKVNASGEIVVALS